MIPTARLDDLSTWGFPPLSMLKEIHQCFLADYNNCDEDIKQFSQDSTVSQDAMVDGAVAGGVEVLLYSHSRSRSRHSGEQ